MEYLTFNELPLEIKKLAEINRSKFINRWGPKNIGNGNEEKTLGNSFNWEQSDQKEAFWKKINNKEFNIYFDNYSNIDNFSII